MKASIEHPVYSAKIIHNNGATNTTYKLKDITTDLVVSHQKDDLAEKVDISVVNIKVGSQMLSNLISVKDRVYVNANTGSGENSVFSGIVWERTLSEDSDNNEIKYTCYDNLIYLHKSKDNFFAKAGKQTDDLIKSLASKWGFKVSYKYVSISHAKLTFHNQSIADIIVEILDKVKKQTGVGYVIRMDGNTIVIASVGSNKTVYKLAKKENAVSTYFKESMEDMVTKVLIVKAETTKNGNSEKETGRYLTVASVDRNTSQYGTLQQILTLDKDENLADSKEEANQTLKDHSTPKITNEVSSVDIPWVNKGDQIYISAGNFNNYYIVESIEHDALKGLMYLEVSKYE